MTYSSHHAARAGRDEVDDIRHSIYEEDHLAVLKLLYLLGWLDENVSIFGVRIGVGLDAVKLLAVLAFMQVSLSVGTAGAQQMIFGQYALMTWLGVIGVGILVPLAIGVYTIIQNPEQE